MITYIFDFDGVICDSKKVIYEIHNKLAKKYGLRNINNSYEYLKYIDNNNIERVIEEKEIKDYYIECNKYYNSKLDELKLFPYIKKIINESKDRIVIITSTYEDFVYKVLKNCGIKKDVYVLGKSVKPNKTDRLEIYLEKNNVKKDDIIYIGDTMNDYLFCEQCGIKMIGTNYGYSDLTQIEDKLLYLFNTDKDLYEYIKRRMV